MPAEDLHPPVAGAASPSFIETFMLRAGELIAGELHRERMLRTLRGQGVETSSTFLQSLLSTSPWREVEAYLTGQQILPATTYRLTLEYSLAGISAIRLVPYCKRTICTLRPIPLPNDFDYSYKYADRRFFERVKAELADDEEPLFVRPDGTITEVLYFVNTKVCATVKYESINFFKTTFIKKKGNTFASSKLTFGMLAVDSLLTTA